MVNIMDISNIFSMLLNNKNNATNNFNNQNIQQNNNQNIYPNCIPNNQKENIKNNNYDNDFLSTLLPLVMSGQNISMQEILKKMGSNNPMIATLLKKVENKPSTPKQMSKIDVSGLVKVKQE